MRFIYLLICICGASTLFAQSNTNSSKASDMKDRIKRVRESIVRIFVEGQPAGSGFVVSKDGLVATCFHVVQKNEPAPNNQTRIIYSPNVEVEFANGTKIAATVHASCQNQGFGEALSKDYCILQVPSRNLSPLAIGTFADVQEGDRIFLGGFPLGIAQPVFATGMLSTKWSTTGYLNQGGPREAAWLDITMNSGNSGGPVLLLSDKPEMDKVIGIATFGLNPFAGPAEELVGIVQGFPGNVVIMGVDFKKFGTLVGSALMSTSLGVNGCISIDYMKSKLP